MKIKVTADELAEFVVLLCQAHGIDRPVADPEENKYTKAVGAAIKQVYDVVEEVPEKTEKAKPKKGRKVDTGKIKALYDGKWSIKAIADEMKCSEQTVRNVIKEALDEGK